jgi:hypothetical protein
MSKVTVTFKVVKMVRSRYGYVPRVTEERKRCEESELDSVVAQFRSRFEVIEVRATKDC